MTSREKNKYIIHVEDDLMKRLERFIPVHTYTESSCLYYEDQTPFVAYLIKEGKGSLFKNRRKDIPIADHQLIGIREVLNKIPSTYGAKIEKESKVFFLDLSTLKGFLKTDVEPMIKKFLEQFLTPEGQ